MRCNCMNRSGCFCISTLGHPRPAGSKLQMTDQTAAVSTQRRAGSRQESCEEPYKERRGAGPAPRNAGTALRAPCTPAPWPDSNSGRENRPSVTKARCTTVTEFGPNSLQARYLIKICHDCSGPLLVHVWVKLRSIHSGLGHLQGVTRSLRSPF